MPMQVTLLGTGSPIPLLERAGTSVVVSVDGRPYLLDCGPRAVYELMRNGINPGAVDQLLFTHHHVDHNAAFYHLAIAGWAAGRESLTVYGPAGTDTLIDSLYEVYEEDLAYRAEVGYPLDAIRDIEWVPVDGSFAVERDGVAITAHPVSHSIETYAYRLESDDGAVVFTGDTAPCEGLAAFAAGAGVLVHDAALSPVGEPPDEGFVWDRYTEPYPERARERLAETHCSPTEAAETAAAAGVDTLVLTHLPPYRDADAMRSAAAATFDGEVVVAEDGLTLSVA